MLDQNATTQAQVGRKTSQIPKGDPIPMEVIMIIFILGLMAFGAIKWYIGVAVIAAGYAYYLSVQKRKALEEATARAAVWANHPSPIVVFSWHPGETLQELHERAEFIRAQLRLSGNYYANLIPVIEVPFRPMLYENNQLSGSFARYIKEVCERIHIENVSWYEGKCPNELKEQHANAVLPAPKNENQI